MTVDGMTVGGSSVARATPSPADESELGFLVDIGYFIDDVLILMRTCLALQQNKDDDAGHPGQSALSQNSNHVFPPSVSCFKHGARFGR